MNLKELASIDEELDELYSHLEEAETADQDSHNYILNQIEKLENRRDRLLGITNPIKKMPLYDENY